MALTMKLFCRVLPIFLKCVDLNFDIIDKSLFITRVTHNFLRQNETFLAIFQHCVTKGR